MASEVAASEQALVDQLANTSINDSPLILDHMQLGLQGQPNWQQMQLMQGQMIGGFRPPRYNLRSPIPPPGYVCKICGVLGHWIQNCPEGANANKTNNSVPPSGYVCRICNTPGHWIQQCPSGNVNRGPMPNMFPPGPNNWRPPPQPPRYDAFGNGMMAPAFMNGVGSYPSPAGPHYSFQSGGSPSLGPGAPPAFGVAPDGGQIRPLYPPPPIRTQPYDINAAVAAATAAAAAASNNVPPTGNGEEASTLWMGDLQPWMTDKYLVHIFFHQGEKVTAKVILDKQGRAAGYGFIRFASQAVALRVLKTLNGQMIPGTDRVFRLNWALHKALTPTRMDGEQPPLPSNNNHLEDQSEENGPLGEQAEDGSMVYSIFVGNLSPEIDQNLLVSLFTERYSSIRGGRVVVNPTTYHSKGFGFVTFGDREEALQAMTEMQGHPCGDRPLRISSAKRRN